MAALSRSEIEPGDHIYTPETPHGHTHHGIYVGNNRVIHFSFQHTSSKFTLSDAYRPCDECNFSYSGERVVLTCLDCFLLRGEIYRYEYGVSGKRGISTTARSDSPDVVIRRAAQLLQTGGYKHPANCENFAIYCKTEKNLPTGQKDAPLVKVEKLSRSEIVPGDHIFTYKSGSGHDHNHHGIYIAENQVIHFTLQHKNSHGSRFGKVIFPCSECGFECGGGVVLSCLDCFRLEGDIYRYEYGVYGEKGGSTTRPSDSEEEAIERAKNLCNHAFGDYDDPSNCENFAFFCKTTRFLSMESNGGYRFLSLGLSALAASAIAFIIRATR